MVPTKARFILLTLLLFLENSTLIRVFILNKYIISCQISQPINKTNHKNDQPRSILLTLFAPKYHQKGIVTPFVDNFAMSLLAIPRGGSVKKIADEYPKVSLPKSLPTSVIANINEAAIFSEPEGRVFLVRSLRDRRMNKNAIKSH